MVNPFTMQKQAEQFGGLCEIRWHARGGQGAVTAAKMVAEMALGQGMFFQAFPEYGPERSGAPIVAFTRVSSEPIQIYCGVEQPQIVIVLDPSLFGAVDVTKGAPEDAIILVNSEMTPQQLREQYKIEGRKLYTIARWNSLRNSHPKLLKEILPR